VAPSVRVVVVNYNGGELTLRCLESLRGVDWPPDRLEVILVDNASRDGSFESVRTSFPEVKVIQAETNLGYAGGNNLALRDLVGVDYVALLNNDTVVDRNWLASLVRALEADPSVGAACPKILFADPFIEVELATDTFRPRRGDRRRLGVRVSGINVDGRDRLADTQLLDAHGWEHGYGNEETFQWTAPRSRIRIPVDSTAPSETAQVRVAAERKKSIVLRSGAWEGRFVIGREPRWLDLHLAGPQVDVINNVGSVAIAGGYGGDRGFLEVDAGQYNEPAEVFGWCGCAVLLRRRYLEEVGLFDPRFFLYYEDFDLSWRGRAQGWRYVYVPQSVVRHVHTATTVEGSSVYQHYVERNRLLAHAKNAPATYAAYAFVRYAGGTIRYALLDVVSPLLRGDAPRAARLRRRLRTAIEVISETPRVLRERQAVRKRQRVPDRELLQWRVRPGPR
jgi:GT2 family glycosyltransferase